MVDTLEIEICPVSNICCNICNMKHFHRSIRKTAPLNFTAKNVLKILNASKSQDKKALQDAQQNMSESSQKLDLIRHSLELVRQDLPPGSLKAQEQKQI